MSERILKALMQLFAIISEVDVDGVSTDRREVVKLFLKQQLNQELVEEYFQVFEGFLGSQKKKQESATKRKRTSVNSVKVLRICTQINEELAQTQKVIVLIRLIEFINSENNPSEQEIEFVTTVAETFNIDQTEFKRAMSFVKSTVDNITESSKILIVDGNPTINTPEVKHITCNNLNGQIRVLHIPSVNIYALQYYGTAELYLNGQIIHADRIYVLNPGSSIRSSKTSPVYYSDIVGSYMKDVSKDKIVYQVKDLEFRFKAGNIGLHNMSLTEESGRMIGIMGGSGAGKSTLLNVLNGVEKPSSGQVLINGIDIHKEKGEAEGVIGFVPQDDLLMEDLTVYQNLFYAAKLCFGNYTDEKISEMCLNLLGDIGLYEAKHLKVGSPLEKVISGGQRKRLNIALELIREPSVLFLDEPTSGLSSRDSENIMDLLKELALKGKLIYVVIHQPSSDIFKMFDKLIILDVGGYIIYNGNPVDAVIYFKKLVNHVNPDESECVQCGNVNPEQIFNIIESKIVDEFGSLTRTRKVAPKQWNEHYLEKIASNIENQKIKTDSKIPDSTFKIPNTLKQIKVFIIRDVLSKLTNTQYLTINLLEAPVLGLILAYFVKYYNTDISNDIGYMFRENENIPIYMFMAVVVMLFIGLTVSAEEIIKDRKILKREAFLNLSKGGYLFSKIAIMFVLSSIQTLCLIGVGNYILEIRDMGMDYWLVLFSAACFANMLGLNISSAFNSAVTIYILIPFILIPQLLFSGVMVKFDKLNPLIIVHNSVPVIGEMMVTRWAYEAMAVNQFITNHYEKHFYDFDKQKSIADFKKNYWIPRLETKISNCIRNQNIEKAQSEYIADLNLIKTELEQGSINNQDINTTFSKELIQKITKENFTPEIGNQLNQKLEQLHKLFVSKYNNVSHQKDKAISARNNTKEKRELFKRVKNQYENEALSDLVSNKTELDKIKEVDGELVQQSNPIYLDPLQNSNIRTHFFAPQKRIMGTLLPTFWVNIMVIWSMSILLIITLYFDFFRKTIDSMGNIGSNLAKLIPSKSK